MSFMFSSTFIAAPVVQMPSSYETWISCTDAIAEIAGVLKLGSCMLGSQDCLLTACLSLS